MTVRTTLELRSDERFLRVTHELDNRARDHRLRAHFPLPGAVTGSDAECAFAVVHRGLDRRRRRRTSSGCRRSRRGGSSTRPTGASGCALLHDGLLEYEVVDDGRELALTLLRATGYLSRSEPVAAAEPGRPARSRCTARRCSVQQRLRVRGAPPPRRLARGRLLRRGRRVPRAVRARPGRSAGRRAGPRPGARCASTAPRCPRCRALPAGSTVRVFRTAADAGAVTIEHEGAPARGWVVDLAGRPVAPFEGERRAAPVGDLHPAARVGVTCASARRTSRR